VDGDITSVSDFLSKVVPKAAGALLLVLGMVIVLGFLDWRLGLGMAIYLAMSVGVVIGSRHRAVSESSDEMNSLARLYGGIEERLTAAEDLRSNGAANHVAWRFVEDSSDALASGVRRERAFLIMWWFVQGTVAAGWVIVLILGAILVAGNVITVGTAFLLFQYVLLISRPLEDVVHQLETVQKANGAMVRVIDLLAISPKILDNGSTSPSRGPLSVECRNVNFDYGDAGDSATGNHVSHDGDTPTTVNGQRVLHNVDLRIGAGRSVGIVGRTGSGKTTLSRLVLRLVEAISGDVLIGGVPVADIPLAELRHRVALVPQEVELFAGTIRDNITLFDDTRADAAVVAALRGVGLNALADGGIHQSLGAGRAGLSAGEAQLLALARVWLRDPDLLVLDEATARVDPQTEQQLEAAIGALMEGRTTLVIAHRLSTLRTVDDIIVFDHGRIVEAGPRSELVEDDDSRFKRLLTLALENEDTAEPSSSGGSSADGHR
jgi:ABC-type multidrug transport system fused ATPase/permease subunit